MNASRHAVELVGDELEQAEPAEALTLEPPELLEELPDLAEALPELLLEEPPEPLEELLELPPELPVLPVLEAFMAIVAELGVPKPATPATKVNARLKLLPAAVALTGTEIVFAEVSPSAQLTVPLVEEKSAPAVAVPLTVV
ncbi:MAG: hypothetical protein ABSF31_13605 [Steroidobacteraceae bacterium]